MVQPTANIVYQGKITLTQPNYNDKVYFGVAEKSCKLKDLLNLIIIIWKVSEKRTKKILAKEVFTSKVKPEQKEKKSTKTLCNQLRDSPHLDHASRGNPLCELCPNTEFFLVRIFQHWDWIRRDTPYLSVFSPNAGKYGA